MPGSSLHPAARDALRSGHLGHLVTLDPDGREAWASLHCNHFSLANAEGGGLIFQAFDITGRRQAAEPLPSFPHGALVHFAVSNSEAFMTTRLAGPATTFLPFNKGDGGGKGRGNVVASAAP